MNRNFVTIALCCYDFCLTFTRELKFMWKLKPSTGSLLFFTLRYPALCNTIMVILGYLSWGAWQTQLVSDESTVQFLTYFLPSRAHRMGFYLFIGRRECPACTEGSSLIRYASCQLHGDDASRDGGRHSHLDKFHKYVHSPLLPTISFSLVLHNTVFTALRIYALSARSKWRLGWMLALGLINPVMSTVRRSEVSLIHTA